jgi:hypothetical protein
MRTSLRWGGEPPRFLSSRSCALAVLLKAIVLPSGDHTAGEAPRGTSVSWRASPPAAMGSR